MRADSFSTAVTAWVNNALSATVWGMPVVAIAALVSLVVVGAVILATTTIYGASTARFMTRSFRAGQLKNIKGGGALILVAGGGRAARRLREALDQHFPAFTFGAPVIIASFPLSLPTSAKLTERDRRDLGSKAARWLGATEADLIVWGRENGIGGRLDVRMMTPGLAAQVAPMPTMMTQQVNGKDEEAKIALAYMAARLARPILARPQDFKADKLKPIVERLDVVAATTNGKVLDPNSARLIADDFAAAAANIGDRFGDPVWLEKSLAAVEAALPFADRQRQPADWARLKHTTGRAKAALGEIRRDQRMLMQARQAFQEALDALAQTPELGVAQAAARGMARTEAALETLRKPQPQEQPGRIRSFYGSYAASTV